MTDLASDKSGTRSRLAILDVMRGLAVVAMAIYHLSWDLSWFAFVDWPVVQGPGWRAFAACIAGSFLFLAGISLDLAHHKAIRWRPFWKREAIIIAAAATVSIVTYFMFGNSFVRFGILHSIAAASLVALPFTRLPPLATMAGAAVFLTMPLWAASSTFDGPVWVWTGLGNPGFASVDNVPLTPWAGITLAGVAASSLARRTGVWQKLSLYRFGNFLGILTRFFGRHSLPVYLLHQPLLYGLVWMAAALGSDADRPSTAFIRTCTQACKSSWSPPESCEMACACTLKHMKDDGIWNRLTVEPNNQSLRTEMNNHHALCLADPER